MGYYRWLKEEAWAKDQAQRDWRLNALRQVVAQPKDRQEPQWYVTGERQTMVVIPGPVVFRMGSPPEEKGRHEWEGPEHTVKLTRPFYVGIHPVTQSQYQLVTGRNPSYFVRTLGGSPDHFFHDQSSSDAASSG